MMLVSISVDAEEESRSRGCVQVMTVAGCDLGCVQVMTVAGCDLTLMRKSAGGPGRICARNFTLRNRCSVKDVKCVWWFFFSC